MVGGGADRFFRFVTPFRPPVYSIPRPGHLKIAFLVREVDTSVMLGQDRGTL